MSGFVPRRAAALLALLAGLAAAPAGAEDQVGNFGMPEKNALPFRIEFNEITPPPGMPKLHSFRRATTDDGKWLMIGGRGGVPPGPDPDDAPATGLHGFAPPVAKKNNFPQNSFNPALWVFDPLAGQVWSFDTSGLDADLAAALTLTSQQSWYDREAGQLWVVGGYGWKGDDMTTYDTMLRIDVQGLVDAIVAGDPAETVAKSIEMLSHDKLAVTGGELVKVGDSLYLVFGQYFDGQYFAFGSGSPPFTQIYTEEVREIDMVPGKFEVLDVSALPKDNPAEYHRRDLNVKMAKDPATGDTVVGIYGGVFKSGGPGGFFNPILFDPAKATLAVQDAIQLFNAYATAVVPVWAESAGVMSQVFFGGIGHGVYHTHDQKPGFDNDGMPFGSDISVLTHEKDGTWAEFVLEDPVPGNKLLAANGAFFVHPDLRRAGAVEDEEIVLLDKITRKTLIGWIYGGILAELPQPPKGPPPGCKGTKCEEVPTSAADNLFEVWLTPGAGAAIPVLQR